MRSKACGSWSGPGRGQRGLIKATLRWSSINLLCFTSNFKLAQHFAAGWKVCARGDDRRVAFVERRLFMGWMNSRIDPRLFRFFFFFLGGGWRKRKDLAAKLEFAPVVVVRCSESRKIWITRLVFAPTKSYFLKQQIKYFTTCLRLNSVVLFWNTWKERKHPIYERD